MKDLPELEGFWWVPAHPEQQLAGRLLSDGGAAKLDLTYNSPDPSGAVFRTHEPRDYEILHGRTADGKLVSLLKCFDLNSTLSSSGVEKRSIFVNYVLVGALVPQEILGSAFSELSLKWPSLNRWFFRSGIEVQYDKDDPRAFGISYRPQAEFRFPYTENCEIRLGFSTDKLPMGGPLSDGVEFREIAWISLAPEQPSNLEYFLDRLNELVHFFSVCLLEYNHPEAAALLGNFDIDRRGDGKARKPKLDLYFSNAQRPQSDRLPHPAEVLIPYSCVQTAFPSLLRNWAAVASDLSPSRSLYFSALYGPKQYVESTFLSLAQAAEVMHRRLHGGTYIAPEDFESGVKSLLLKAIPCELPAEIRSAFSQKLAFFNEISLAKRLKFLCKRHEKAINEFVPDWKKTVRKVVDARNYYTHYSNAEISGRPNINDLVDGREFLRMLLELEMLAATGIEMQTLHERAHVCERYRWRFPRDSA